MNIRKSLLAAALAALPLLPAGAAPLMNGPALQTPQARAALAAQLALQRPMQGLDADHDYSFSSQHPGEQGTQVIRADHTYKGVRVFGSESVIVANGAGKIISESVAERRQFLGKGLANRLGAATADFSVKPAIGPQDAIDAALRSVGRGGVPVAPPRAELIVYPIVTSERLPSAANKPEDLAELE